MLGARLWIFNSAGTGLGIILSNTSPLYLSFDLNQYSTTLSKTAS